ncbi:IclR family transcriptional regulator C-terminal domain-containing protein [Streptomyces niger]|uniref:IclR family transcriptional regulator C-terminal domain-containing protein n=1 Tax=Streptomyces niger TaxID=66373 RepID=UPI0018FF003B|nr:IclR family transcriptional regulator C-terminal domain-containing protein [Streptomyces niger]
MQPSLISVLTLHFEDAAAPCPPMNSAELATLVEVFDRPPDPRRVRERRYRLGSLLGLCLVPGELEVCTPDTISDRNVLLKDLQEVREQEYAVMDNELAAILTVDAPRYRFGREGSETP